MNTVITNDYDPLNRLNSVTSQKNTGTVADEYMLYQFQFRWVEAYTLVFEVGEESNSVYLIFLDKYWENSK